MSGYAVARLEDIEEIRRLSSRMDGMTKESERALAEVQMLFGSHVFARAEGIPDLAISRGEEAYRQARVMGDRSLEFLAAGGTAMALLEVGELEGVGQWLERAAATATEAPTPFRARTQLAKAVGLPEDRILVHVVNVGGDFGGKGDSVDAPIAYLLAKQTGQPVP